MKKILKSFLFILFICINAYGIEGNVQKLNLKKPMDIVAEKVILERNKQEITFIKKVVAKQDKFTLYADKMIVNYIENKNKKTEIKNIKAINNVKFTTDEIIATGDNGYYNLDNNTIILKNNVKIIENGITLLANEFKYFTLTGKTEIEGKKDSDDRVTIILDDNH